MERGIYDQIFSTRFKKCKLVKLFSYFDMNDVEKWVEELGQQGREIYVVYGYAKGGQYALLIDKSYFSQKPIASFILSFKVDNLCLSGDDIYIVEDIDDVGGILYATGNGLTNFCSFYL